MNILNYFYKLFCRRREKDITVCEIDWEAVACYQPIDDNKYGKDAFDPGEKYKM